jgi:hypothetical protein
VFIFIRSVALRVEDRNMLAADKYFWRQLARMRWKGKIPNHKSEKKIAYFG